jgi:ribosomal protein S18 acetylase RimI-like enzyme
MLLLREGIRRHGVAGSLQRIASMIRRDVGRRVALHEQHVWYALELAASHPPIQWQGDIAFSRIAAHDLAYLSQLETVGNLEARQRLAQGAELWLAREGPHAVFACWIFRNRTPVLAARGGWLELPDGVVCLEDSVTSPAYRGRGIAPAAWSRVANELQHEGSKTIITKVASDNVPSRRAVERAGFRPLATMTLDQRWLNTRVHVGCMTQKVDRITAHLQTSLAR